MDITLVLESFMLVSGLTKEEAEKWLPLCHWAVASLYGRLRSDADVVTNQKSLCYAAGVAAYYKYMLRMAAQTGSSRFSVGDVTVTENISDGVQAAKTMYDEAIASVEQLFGDGFAFMGVVT